MTATRTPRRPAPVPPSHGVGDVVAPEVVLHDRMSLEDETALVRRWQEASDARALDVLVRAQMPLVRRVVRGLRGYGIPADDLLQEGMVGVLEGIRRFDVDRGLRLSTYCVYWVRAQLYDYVFRDHRLVRCKRDRSLNLFFKLRAARQRLETQFGSGPHIDGRLAAMFGVTEQRIREASARLAGGVLSLDAPGEDGTTLFQKIATGVAGPDVDAARSEVRSKVDAALQTIEPKLSTRERSILRERLMESGDGEATLASLGERYGVTRERMRQIEARLVGVLRTELQSLDAA